MSEKILLKIYLACKTACGIDFRKDLYGWWRREIGCGYCNAIRGSFPRLPMYELFLVDMPEEIVTRFARFGIHPAG